MTGPYPPADADGHDAPGAGAADLSYADVAAAPEQPAAELPPAGPEAPEQPGIARVYAWPSPPPAVPSEVDPSAVASDVDYVDDDMSTVDDEVVATTEAEPEDDAAELEPSIVEEAAAESEPTDPAVARMRAVQARLGELDDLPIEEHPARYEELHSELTGALAQIDRAPDSQA